MILMTLPCSNGCKTLHLIKRLKHMWIYKCDECSYETTLPRGRN